LFTGFGDWYPVPEKMVEIFPIDAPEDELRIKLTPNIQNRIPLTTLYSHPRDTIRKKGDGVAYMEQETQQQLEKIEGKPGIPIPPLPRWPTSIPGPLVTEPPQGQRRMATRTDQVVEVEYNQES